MKITIMKYLLLIALALFGTSAIAKEFGGLCAMGLAEGKRIETDCEVTWISNDERTYCFRTEDAKGVFLENPDLHLQKAIAFFATMDVKRVGNEMGKYKSKQVRQFILDHISAISMANDDVFPLRDSILGKDLKLVFDEIDFIRTLHGYGFFPSVKFHRLNEPEKRYIIDFWLRPEMGELAVIDTRIYKAPRRYDGKWTLWMRDPRPWWWIPASEHPGESEEKRGWEIISAIENQIITATNDKGEYSLVDPETGKKVDLEFIGVHLPVRRLNDDGRYFACTDFRRHGSDSEYYDIDFWLNEDSGKIEVGEIRIHKVPRMIDGGFIQIPRYSFDDLDAEVVP
jgi:hypothetical protein